MTKHFTDGWTQSGDGAALTRAAGRLGAWTLLGGLLLVIAANLFAAAYVSAEHYIYYWDWSLYWLKFEQLGELARADGFAASAAVAASIRNDEYNLLQVVPLLPFELVGGSGRETFIVAITNMGVLPSAALMALIPERLAERQCWPRYLFCTAVLLCLHPLWAAALRGFPDVIGVAIASGVLLTYFKRPLKELRRSDFVRLGVLLCLLVLTRRWYLFWAAAFFPAAIAAFLVAPPERAFERRRLVQLASGLATAGASCLILLLALAGPIVVHVAVTDYATAFAAYRSQASGPGQVEGQFGLALLGIAAIGLGCLVANRRTRALGTFVSVQAALSLLLFTHVQKFLGVQHYYILVPALGIGVAGALHAVWNAARPRAWKIAGSVVAASIVLLSSFSVFSPAPVTAGPLLPRQSYPPLVRPDLAEIDRLLDRLEQIRPERVYVVASSEVLNWSTLKMGCRDRHRDLCDHIAVTSDIDARDGFPFELAGADTVVIATPVQFHVDPADQRTIGLVARDLLSHRRIGRSFALDAGEFQLKQGVKARILRRTAPISDADLRALSAELQRAYPGMAIFRYPQP